jgi:hypothetical protein
MTLPAFISTSMANECNQGVHVTTVLGAALLDGIPQPQQENQRISSAKVISVSPKINKLFPTTTS